MPSPFPGMDPYLEEPARWPDLHHRLITYISNALQKQVRPRYHARIGERIYILQPPRALYPDVLLVRRPVREPAPAGVYAQDTEAAVTAGDEELQLPVVFTLPPVEHREPFIEIVHAAGEEVVTVIEVLSPANKASGEGQRLYHRKQQEILHSSAHLVEIDLLAEGLHTVALPEEGKASLPPHRYLVSVNRATDEYRFELYPISLQRRLPHINVPLREPDPDAVVDLQAVFTQCYDDGGYEDFVNYRRPPQAMLSPEEAAWVDGLLRGKGIRSKR
ncbi:MAG: DUF4058 family protein [Chloroflexota bacterium]|nr:DUF4058 family protein [Chloroflexota bacterium]